MRIFQKVVLLFALFFPFAGWAESDAALDAVRQKINVAGRQRMLSQRMAAAACLSMSRIDVQRWSSVAETARREYEAAMIGLIQGDAALGLVPEKDPIVRSSTTGMKTVWAGFHPALQQLSAGDLHPVAIRQLVEDNMPLMEMSNRVVQTILRTYGAQVGGDPAMSRTIDVAGRQRMLSQKILKEACLLGAGLEEVETLQQTMARFDSSLSHLLSGDEEAGILPPPTGAVASQLAHVTGVWRKFQAGLNDLQTATESARLQALGNLADQADRLLLQMHRAVGLYVSG